jgi:hypothetical protein
MMRQPGRLNYRSPLINPDRVILIEPETRYPQQFRAGGAVSRNGGRPRLPLQGFRGNIATELCALETDFFHRGVGGNLC